MLSKGVQKINEKEEVEIKNSSWKKNQTRGVQTRRSKTRRVFSKEGRKKFEKKRDKWE